jgi:hypothetical protein
MNSPSAYSLSNVGTRIDASFVSPLHGLDRTTITTHSHTHSLTLSHNISPIKNNIVQEKLNKYYSLVALLNGHDSDDVAVAVPVTSKGVSECVSECASASASELIIDVTTPPKKDISCITSPHSTRRRRQSLLVIEALENISTVSKTPTKMKIRKSCAFLESATKMRVETPKQNHLIPKTDQVSQSKQFIPKATTTNELLGMLEKTLNDFTEKCSLLALDAEENGGQSVMLQSSCAEEMEMLMSPAEEVTPSLLSTHSIKIQQSSHSLTPKEAHGAIAKTASTPTRLPVSSRKREKGHHGGTPSMFGDENMCHNTGKTNSPLPTTPTSATRRASRFANVLNSCSKVLQEIDITVK